MAAALDPASVAAAVEAVVRADRGRLLAALIARLRDFQLADDALQDALGSALIHWGRTGLPASPQGWLLRVALRKAIDRLRRAAREARKVADLTMLADAEASATEPEANADERLRLVFTCCHPALEPKTRVALTLRTLGGLSTAEVAGAFLDAEPAMGQRLSRARSKIARAGIPFEVPEPEAWAERLQSVLTVIYLIFNAGYSASEVAPSIRATLCDEAIYLGRMLDQLQPGDPEIEGLLALMLITHARRDARFSEGASVPLEAQDRRRWDHARIDEGVAVLDRAMARRAVGPCQIKAAIAALHVADGVTDWRQIVLLYDSLIRFEATPVVQLNRAVALAEAGALAAGQRVLDALAAELDAYQPFHAARAELLRRAGRAAEASLAYDRAIALAAAPADVALLQQRRAALTG